MFEDFINNVKEGVEAVWKGLEKGLETANVIRIGLGSVTQKMANEAIVDATVRYEFKKIQKSLQTSSESVYASIQGEFADAVRDALKKQAQIFGYKIKKNSYSLLDHR